ASNPESPTQTSAPGLAPPLFAPPDHAGSGCPMAFSCHSLWGYTPCAPLPCDSASGQARTLTLKGRLPRPPSRFAQSSLHLLPAPHRHWLVLASKPLATSRALPPARKGCRSEIASPVWLSYSASLASPGVSPAASLLLPVAPLPAFLS